METNALPAETDSDGKPLTVSCDCIEKTNALMAEKGCAFRLEEQPLTINNTTGVMSFLNRVILSTEWQGKPTAADRKKGKRMVATYCPFCGEKYEFAQEATARIPKRTREPLNMIDNRSDRWKAAEARISAGLKDGRQPDPADLAIVVEEQDAWDGNAEAEMEAELQGREEAERAKGGRDNDLR